MGMTEWDIWSTDMAWLEIALAFLLISVSVCVSMSCLRSFGVVVDRKEGDESDQRGDGSKEEDADVNRGRGDSVRIGLGICVGLAICWFFVLRRIGREDD